MTTSVRIAGWFDNGVLGAPMYLSSLASATPIQIVGYGALPASATAMRWSTPKASGAIPVRIVGYGGAVGGGGAIGSTWSAADASANGMAVSTDGLTLTVTAGSLHNTWQIARSTIGRSSGKLYAELTSPTGMGVTFHIGLANSSVNINNYLGASASSFGWNPPGSGTLFATNFLVGTTSLPSGAAAANDVFGLAVDFTTGYVYISRNGVWNDSAPPPTVPQVGFTPGAVEPLFIAMAFSTGGPNGSWVLHTTAASQKYAPPTGFTAWDGGGAPSAPVNTIAPVVSGTATIGSTLSCTTGTWSNSPTSYAYQWQRGGVNISGATSSTYVAVLADGGTSVTCVVTATNAGGSTPATSNALSIAATPQTTITRGRRAFFRNGVARVTSIHRGGTFTDV